MLMKATRWTSSGASKTADGTSTMIPATSRSAVARAAPDNDPAASDRSASNRSTSSTVAIIGAITWGIVALSAPARAIARSWPISRSGRVRARRIPADPQERVRFGGKAEVRDLLVAADVGQSDDDRTIRAECGEDAPIRPSLLLLGGRSGPAEEQELGPQQADALGAHQQRSLDLARSAEIGQQTDGVAVPGDATETA